jgi:hypothetical protein
MQNLGSILRKFVKDIHISDGAVLNSLRRKWTEIVGHPVSAHTYPDIIKGKILTIIVDTPQWMHHLSFFKDELSAKLGAFHIESVRFRIGRIPDTAVNAAEERSPCLTDEDAEFIEHTVRPLEDNDLKKKFEKLMTRGLTKGKARKK